MAKKILSTKNGIRPEIDKRRVSSNEDYTSDNGLKGMGVITCE